jgi:alpha,alpha-trehalose phosphorylase
VYGFAGLIDTGDRLEFRPRLPKSWTSMSFRLQRHGSSIRVTVDTDGATVELVDGLPVPIRTSDGRDVLLEADTPQRLT